MVGTNVGDGNVLAGRDAVLPPGLDVSDSFEDADDAEEGEERGYSSR